MNPQVSSAKSITYRRNLSSIWVGENQPKRDVERPGNGKEVKERKMGKE